MKIALVNVRYSPNLGDGLLSECLEAELARQMPAAQFVSVDLAGRTAYGSVSHWRRPAMAVLMRAPKPLRRRAARWALDRLMARLTPQYATALSTCDAAIVGGGNLFADADLNFPMKIAGAMNAAGTAKAGGLPTAIYAVGVSRNWSAEGARLFQGVLGTPSLVAISVRDELSRDALLVQAPAVDGGTVAIVRDPGLLASRHFATPPKTAAAGPIGLCITDPLLLRYHGGQTPPEELETWFGDLARDLAARGHDVLLFTNGSPEDRAFLARHAADWQAADRARIRLADPSDTPAELVRTIAGCSAVIAHRMHACIVAHSFAIPTIGLRWDPKLDAFFDLAARNAFLHVAGQTPVATVVASAGQALDDGVDGVEHAALLADTVNDVATLAATLRSAIPA